MQFVHVKRYKRGAKWGDGQPRMCDRCGVLHRNTGRRRRRASFTAIRLENGFRMPVAYCTQHEPIEVA